MDIRLKKTIQNTGITDIFLNAAYLFNFTDKSVYKTLDFDHIVWESKDIKGVLIPNGKSSIICIEDGRTLFIDNNTGELVKSVDFRAFSKQLDSPFEKKYIFGYTNSVYRNNIFYRDVGYFNPTADKFIVLKEQYDGSRPIWISTENILFLKKESIEYFDYIFNRLWELSFAEIETEQVLTCIDQDRFLFIIAEKGRLLKVDKASGYIVDVFQHSTWGNFRHNYFFRKDGQLILLSHDFYMEISPDNFEIKKQINFSHEDIFVKDCFFDEENQCVYFYGTYGDSFPNLIGSFDINTASFIWKYIMKSEGKGNRFFNSPVPVGDFIVVRDGLKNVYVFEKEE